MFAVLCVLSLVFFLLRGAQAVCTDCPKGHWSNVGASSCSKCEAGTYNEKEGRAGCLPCGAGFYSGVVGAESGAECRKCPPGTLCLAEATAAPKPCKATEGGASCGPQCPMMFKANAGGNGCSPKPMVLMGLGSVALAAVVSATLYARRRVAKRVAEEKGWDCTLRRSVLDYGVI